jgi:hypothetical protein
VTVFRDWFKPRHWTGRCTATWKEAFFDVGGYDESYDPMLGYREDLKLGEDFILNYGYDSIQRVRGAYITSSLRRENACGLRMWTVRGVRNGILID